MDGTGSTEGLALYRGRFLEGLASMLEALDDDLARVFDFVRSNCRKLAGRGDWSPWLGWLAGGSGFAGGGPAVLDVLRSVHSLFAKAVTSPL